MSATDAEIDLKKRELRLSFWTNTILVGVLGGLLTLVVSMYGIHHKETELLLMQKQLDFNYGDLEFRLVGNPLERIVKAPCSQDAKDANTYLQIILNVGIVQSDHAGRYEEVGRRLIGSCSLAAAAVPPTAVAASKCEIVSIRKLGWSSGHKTNFCLGKGFDGVWNKPNSSYDSGGFCYKGDTAAVCRQQIESM